MSVTKVGMVAPVVDGVGVEVVGGGVVGGGVVDGLGVEVGRGVVVPERVDGEATGPVGQQPGAETHAS
ncbi:MAG TPA: hypothetical protein VD866_22305 [Urbifossiella sp.]|nr:hypothetical protein [Urbifossiella sp.]